MLGEGVISTGKELSQTISSDGNETYFARLVEGRGWDIFYSRWEDGEWSDPVVTTFSGPDTDADPYLSSDNNRIFFLSTRPEEGDEPKKFPDIWYVEKTADGWSAPKSASTINTASYGEGFMSLTKDDDLVVASNRPEDNKTHNVYMAEFDGENYQSPELLNAPIKTAEFPNPVISRDGSYLIFDSDKYEGFGGADLYIIFKHIDGWTKPVNLGEKVNSELVEGAPFVTEDGQHLMFNRFRASKENFNSNLYQVYFKPILQSAKKIAGVK